MPPPSTSDRHGGFQARSDATIPLHSAGDRHGGFQSCYGATIPLPSAGDRHGGRFEASALEEAEEDPISQRRHADWADFEESLFRRLRILLELG